MSHPSPAYRPCVGITVINTSGLVWVGRRTDGAGEEEGRGQWWQSASCKRAPWGPRTILSVPTS